MKVTTVIVWLRRFNALLPSLMLIMGGLILAWAALTRNQPPAPAPKTVVAPGQTESLASEVLELRRLDVDLNLGPRIELLKAVSKKKSASTYDTAEIRNLVFVADESEALKWVFPSQAQTLVSVHPLKTAGNEIKAIYVESVDKTSKEKASGYQLSSIYLVSADGSVLKQVLSEVDEVISRRNDEHKLRLIYQKQNTVRMAQIDMQDFRVLADRELAKMSELNK
jgi:hypothetical protein